MNTTVTGVVVAGGNGTRLRPLTDTTSKPLLPIGGRPLVVRAIDQLIAAGIQDLIVVIDQRYASDYMDTLRDGRRFGARSLCYVWQPSQPVGLPAAIGYAEPCIQSPKFVAVCSDVLLEASLRPAVEAFTNQPKGARLVVTNVSDTAGFMPILTHGQAVDSIMPKDKNRHMSGFIDLGTYFYHKDVFSKIRQLVPPNRGETEIGEVHDHYIQQSELYYSEVQGWWADVGSSLDVYNEVNRRYETIESSS